MNFRLVEETLFVRERNLKTFIWWKMKLKTFLRLKPVLKIASIADLQNCFKNTLNKFTNLSGWIFQCWWSMFRPKYTADRCHQHHLKIEQCLITITSILMTTFIVCHLLVAFWSPIWSILVTNFVTKMSPIPVYEVCHQHPSNLLSRLHQNVSNTY